jgi:8-oxo-dGTP diphosphatase
VNLDDTYTSPILTVDAVIFQLIGDKLAVLLIRRGFEPFKGHWALPGGYNPAGETTLQALDRVLADKTGVAVGQLDRLEQLYAFDAVGRDPRGHMVSITYIGLCKHLEPKISATTQEPRFWEVDDLPGLAYDHNKVIMFARDRLRAMLADTNAVAGLLPGHFTLSQLQAAYQAILGRPLDKRNFRKRILAMGMLHETGEIEHGNGHRPARFYSFSQTTPQRIIRAF